MSADPFSMWLGIIGSGLLSEGAKEALREGKRALERWRQGARGKEANALRAAFLFALDDFKRYGDQAQAERFRAFLNEKQAANDTAFGDAMLRALLVDSDVAMLPPDLQSRIPFELHAAGLDFLQRFHQRLWTQSPFDKLLESKAAQDELHMALESLEYQRRTVEGIERLSPRPDYAAQEQGYLAQLIARTELLEFVGVPDPRQNAAIKLEDIFVPLGAEEEIELNPPKIEPPKETDHELVRSIKERVRQIAKSLEGLPRKTMRRVTMEEALRTHMHLMILGDPGAGKSTFLRYLTLVSARAVLNGTGAIHESPLREKRFPILIPLRRFAASNQSLVEFFYSCANQTLQIQLSRGFFERALENGRCLVCLDGLDEVVASEQRVMVRDAVAALATRYPHNRFIVTSRIVGYEGAPLDRRMFAHHTILPFTESEIESFVHKWYAARERDSQRAKSQAEHLFNTIKVNDRLRVLAENPLMLTIIALVHRIEAELPNERVKLYDKCTEALLATWEGVKGLQLSERERERPYYKNRRRLLEKLALWMHTLSQEEGRQAEVKRGDLELKLTGLLLEDDKLALSRDAARAEAQAFIELAKSRTGVLVERGDGIYSFIHLTFQEYFAACDLEARYVYDLERLWKQIQPRLYDPHWQEIILLLLGRLNKYDEPPSIIVEKILRERDKFDEVLHRNLFLAARCLADRVNVRETLRNEIVDALLKFARTRRPRYPLLREDAIQTLGTLSGDDRSGDGLLALMQGENVFLEVRLDAARALARLGHIKEAAYFLLAIAHHKKLYTGFRAYAARTLGQIAYTDDIVIQSLLALAQDDKMNAKPQVTYITSEDEQYVGVRSSAAEALGLLGHIDDAVRLLLAMSQDKKVDSLVREEALKALGRLGRAEDVVIDSLLRLIRDGKESVRVQEVSAHVLAQLGYREEAALFFLTLAHNRKIDSIDRGEAAKAVGQLGCTDATAIHGLLDLLQDKKGEVEVQIGAAQALGQLGHTDDSITRSLSGLAQNQKVDSEVRGEAAKALGQLGYTDTATRVLRELLLDEEVAEWARLNAAQGLMKLGRTDDVIFVVVLRLVRDKKVDIFVRCEAAKALGEIGRADNAVIRNLAILAHDKEIESYGLQDTLGALGKLAQKGRRAMLVLLDLALDKDEGIRYEVYRVLKEVAGNLRYDETSRHQAVASKREAKSGKPKAKNRKS